MSAGCRLRAHGATRRSQLLVDARAVARCVLAHLGCMGCAIMTSSGAEPWVSQCPSVEKSPVDQQLFQKQIPDPNQPS